MPLIVKNTQVKKLYQQSPTLKTQVKKAYVQTGGVKKLIFSAWNGELLDGADKWEDITGGWVVFKGYSANKTPVSTPQGLQFYDSVQGTGWYGARTVKKIDVTNFSKITFTVHSPNNFYVNYFYVGVYDTETQNYDRPTKGANTVYTDSAATDKTLSIDVSGLSGSYYVGVSYYTYDRVDTGVVHYGIMTKVLMS